MGAVRIVVTGRVQGVGFRYFVTRRAGALGVRGEVWNCRDGGVEIVAEHESDETLRDFADSMRDGPGRVAGVIVEPFFEKGYRDFAIGPTR